MTSLEIRHILQMYLQFLQIYPILQKSTRILLLLVSTVNSQP